MFSTKNAFLFLLLFTVFLGRPALAALPQAEEPSRETRAVVPDTVDKANVKAGPTPTEIHKLRVKKCKRIIGTFYNYKGRANFGPHIEYFIWYHEQLERDLLAKGDRRGEGFGSTWWWTLVYGGANFGMTCYGVAPGNCAGPLDVKNYPLILDPRANIRHCVQESLGFYVHKGVRGIDLCKHLMYPARPHDWGGGMFRRTNIKHQNEIVRAYKLGKI